MHFSSLSLALVGGGPRERTQVQAEGRAQTWRHGASEPDVRAAVTPRVAELMGQGWAEGLLPEVYQEVGVQLQSSLFCVYIDLQHDRAFPGDKREGRRER